jgi:hypothetical protein
MKTQQANPNSVYHEVCPMRLYERNNFLPVVYRNGAYFYERNDGVMAPLVGGKASIDSNAPMYISVYGQRRPFPNLAEALRTGELNSDIIPTRNRVFLDFVPFDFDNPILKNAQSDAASFVRYLNAKHGVEEGSLSIYFSGGKGFHVLLDIAHILDVKEVEIGVREPVEVNPAAIARFARELASGFDSFDRVIYDARRVLKVPYGRSHPSALPKIPIYVDDLFYSTPASIIERAIDCVKAWELTGLTPFDSSNDRYSFATLEPERSDSLYQTYLNCCAADSVAESSAKTSYRFSTLTAQAPVGRRNSHATELAGLILKHVDDEPIFRWIMSMWNERNESPLKERELDRILTQTYKRYRRRK